MRRRVSSRLTYANVMSSIALFVALGGISYAAVTLPKNSVGTAQIKKDAVTGAKVKAGSLAVNDLSKGAQAALKGATGAAGAPGAQGAAGAAGAQGPAGPKGDGGAAGSTGTNGTPGSSGVAGPSIIGGSMSYPAFSSPGGSGNFGSEPGALVPVPPGSAYTAKSFVATMQVAPGAGASVTIALRINQVDSALKCTVANAATTCQPAAGTQVTVPAGAKISMQTTVTGAPAGSYISYAFRGEF